MQKWRCPWRIAYFLFYDSKLNGSLPITPQTNAFNTFTWGERERRYQVHFQLESRSRARSIIRHLTRSPPSFTRPPSLECSNLPNSSPIASRRHTRKPSTYDVKHLTALNDLYSNEPTSSGLPQGEEMREALEVCSYVLSYEMINHSYAYIKTKELRYLLSLGVSATRI